MDERRIPEALADYEATLVAMHSRRTEPLTAPGDWNRLVDQSQRLLLAVRLTPEGRAGISALMTHPDSTVRLWASAAALGWDPDIAEVTLTAIAGGEGFGAFEAEITLREWRAGRLNTDWTS